MGNEKHLPYFVVVDHARPPLKFASTPADSRADNYRAVGIWVGQEAQHGSEGTGVDFVSNE